jgi:hypothetical protein
MSTTAPRARPGYKMVQSALTGKWHMQRDYSQPLPPEPPSIAIEDAAKALAKIHEIAGAVIPRPEPGWLTPREEETLIQALEQIDEANKARKAAEQQLADALAGKGTAAAAVSYRARVTARDGGGDLRTFELTPSDPDAPAYRINVVGRDAAGTIKTFDLVPLAPAKEEGGGDI